MAGWALGVGERGAWGVRDGLGVVGSVRCNGSYRVCYKWLVWRQITKGKGIFWPRLWQRLTHNYFLLCRRNNHAAPHVDI